MRIEGGCHCGGITYRADIDPDRVSICHCTDCQTLTGSPYRVTALTDRDHIEITGTPTVYEKIGHNGGKRLQYFCAACGTPVFTSGTGDQAKAWGIRWGSITQRAKLTPKRQIWYRSSPEWIHHLGSMHGKQID